MSPANPIITVPEPLRTILRDYLHVEWFELNELQQDVKNPAWNRRLGAFKEQLRQALTSRAIPLAEVQALTGQEFDDQHQLHEWLAHIWSSLFDEAI